MLENRPSKKQRELLSFIDGFIKGNGYGPSYREVMRALDYKSVSTVATHVDGLIARGLLRKKDNSARSLEVVGIEAARPADPNHLDWLRSEIAKRGGDPNKQAEIKILTDALNLLDQTTDSPV